jgi:methylthioribose-1-phosphate isomerase
MSQEARPRTDVRPIAWEGDARTGHVLMLDQLLLPTEERYHRFHTYQEVAESIRSMIIRGAPAIGIAAAYGLYLGLREAHAQGQDVLGALPEVKAALAKTRPTAVNLFWALDRMERAALALENLARSSTDRFLTRVFNEAQAIHEEDIENNIEMGRLGAELVPQGARILTHCNTGGLATGAYGTALGVVRAAHAQGKLAMVYADETRPYLQGARLTAWECMKDHLPVTLLTDSMAAWMMKQGLVDLVIVGTDRTVANGDVANKIGTYSLAVLCKHHGIPFYVAAPLSTVDLTLASGEQIVIEERSAREVTHLGDRALAPEGVLVRHPAFDVTPSELVTAIITELGVARAPYGPSLAELKARSEARIQGR